MTIKTSRLEVFKAALPHTLPIMAGYVFLGIAYGVLMSTQGFSFYWPILMAMTIYAGSIEFLTVNMLLGVFNPLQALLITLMVNARHIFYGISMLDKYKGAGFKKLFLIAGMSDETFAVNYTAKIPLGINKHDFMLWVTILNYSYWVIGATLGGLFGGLLDFNTEGIEFVLTGMFVVIFVEQWLKDKTHISELLGLILPVIFIVALGPEQFMVPSMIAIFIVIAFMRRFMPAIKEK